MEHLSPQDAMFLDIEDPSTHMHIGSVSVFEGPPPPCEEFEAMVAGKLPLVPRYRQRVRFVPLSLGRPAWVDDPRFNLQYHVRHTALPAPGSDEQLRMLVGRVMSQQLDRGKPLWEMWVVEGLEEDRWALVSKVHHCMVDGVAGTDLLAVLLDTTREPSPPAADDWQPGPEPSDAQVLTDAIVKRALSPIEQARDLRAGPLAPERIGATVRQAVSGLSALAGTLRQTPETSLNGPIGSHRRWYWARSRLSDVKAIREGLGGTVNDVVLAAITGGFRRLLHVRGEPTQGRTVRTLVPVSVRSQQERGTYNNRVSAMFAELPVGLADPAERLASVRDQLAGLKESKQALGGEALVSLSGFAPPLLLALGARVAHRVPYRAINTVTTNVPGPQFPVYAVGRRMLETFPYVPLPWRTRVSVAIFSYDGGLNFGVTGDYDAAADIDALCEGIESGIADLLALAEGVPRPPEGDVGQRAPAPGAATRSG